MLQKKMEDVQKYMVQLEQKFSSKSFSEENAHFWDCVVISAADEKQRECFQQQLDEKLKKGDIPKKAQYIVVSDCPGVALGSGGSTFHILKHLKNLFAEDLFQKKIWISHAGGFSKRLPNLTCIGKLFCPLPLEVHGRATDLLNLKFIISSPFLELMKNGGIFICASDDIETYSFDSFERVRDEMTRLSDEGVVALGHPSTIGIGTTHGVYVLPANSYKTGGSCRLSPCLEVLQKPSYSTMETKGALFKLSDGEERVYTDSMFWCGPNLVKKMVAFAEECEDLYSVETCIYGDFLACMGERPAERKLYFEKISALSAVKQKIANYFGETPLNILVLDRSNFYHLGTMREYLENLNPSAELFKTLGMKQVTQTICQSPSRILGVVTTSFLQADVEMMKDSIMDSCIVGVPIVCEPRTIISHCLIDDPVVNVIPADWLFHTAAVKLDNSVLYITIAFRINDDLKGSVKESCGWKDSSLGSPSDTLWRAHLFEACETMSQSFVATWKIVAKVPSNITSETKQRFCMEDIVQMKYIPAMMEHREVIARKIKTFM